MRRSGLKKVKGDAERGKLQMEEDPNRMSKEGVETDKVPYPRLPAGSVSKDADDDWRTKDSRMMGRFIKNEASNRGMQENEVTTGALVGYLGTCLTNR